jgi:prephenate dehydratase
MTNSSKTIAFQGEHGAFSDMACRSVYNGMTTLPCKAFDDAFQAVEDGAADLAMIPIDNSIAGRVADVHNLMPRHNLHIIGEHYQPVSFCLLAVKGAEKSQLKHVHSHVHALPQCKKITKELGLQAHVHADTAGAAAEIARKNDPAHGAFASALAAEIYDLQIIEQNIQDTKQNTTRFLILSKDKITPSIEKPTICSLIFQVRNIPAALYKSLGGFATNGLSMSKLESYVDANFQVAKFYCEVEGHPESDAFKLALEELCFFARDVKVLGAYEAHEARSRA